MNNYIIILCLSLFLAMPLQADTLTTPMRHWGAEEGLSKSAVTSLLQDESGFLWIGTYDGLNRYDGYQFRIFRPEASNVASLSDNYIQCLLKDAAQKIWIGTKKGLNRYDPVTETFQRIPITTDQSIIEITALCQDYADRIWIGTTQGLCRIDSTLKPQWFNEYPGIESKIATSWIFTITQDTRHNLLISVENEFYNINPENMQSARIIFNGQTTGARVRCCMERADGTLLVGSDNGLWETDAVTGVLNRPAQIGLQQPILFNTSIYSLLTDSSGKLWIGTWGDGVFVYDPETGLLNAVMDEISPQGMQFVYQIMQDRTGGIWIGSKTGVFLFDPYMKPFETYTPQGMVNRRIDWDVTKAIVQDPFDPNILWLNTDKGLYRTQLTTGKSTWMSNAPELKNHFIHSLFMEPSGLLWIGTNGELISLNTKNNKWTRYPEIRHPDASVSQMSFFAILRDHLGIIWLGTFEHGLIRFDPAKKSVRFFFNDLENSTSLPDNHIWTIYEDRQQRLWIGTDQGYALIDKNTGAFKTWGSPPARPGALISNRVRVITQDQENFMWIGTDGGLCRFDPAIFTMQCYSEKDGMLNHVVHGILEETVSNDTVRPLWISTNRGILRLDPETEKWTPFLKQDGLHHTEFSRQSFCKLRDGRLVFGGLNGFTLFDPARFKSNPYPPQVVFTDFQLFYQSVTPGKPFLGKTILPHSITHTRRLVLSRKHEIFSIEFAALHYSHNEKIRYMYRLEGFNEDWIDTKGIRSATYTTLAPGNYTLRVKAASPDDVWSEEDAILQITMTPTFWQRRSVWIGLILLLTASLVLQYKLRTKQIKKRNKRLEQFNTQLQQQIDVRIQAEASLLKSQNQLTNSLKEKELLLRELYHRTKNNMQVISSMLRIHSKTVKNKAMKNLLLEIQNKIMSMALVHQKLYESNDLSHLNLTDYIKSLVSYIKTLPTLHSGNVSFSVEGEEIHVLIDTAIPCGLIINELITNSLKHAFPDNRKGKITIKLQLDKKRALLLVVSDDGVGLPENFDFEKDIHLGLESVIELVKHQLQGTISFKSKNGLTCRICLQEELYKPRI